MTGLFGGVVLADAYFPALERVCLAFNLHEEAVIDRTTLTVEAIGEGGDPPKGQRVWWRTHHPNGSHDFISINPGEFRTEPPPPPCIIRDIPQGAPKRSMREALREAVASCRLVRPALAGEARTLATADGLLARQSGKRPAQLLAELKGYREARDPVSHRSFVERLYDEYFFTHACTVNDFAILLLLLQLQAALGLFMAQDWVDDPQLYLQSYVFHVLKERPDGNQSLDRLRRICSLEFQAGRSSIEGGLTGAMTALPRAQMLAYHHFFNSFSLTKSFARAGIAASEMPIDPIVAEEAVACTFTGILMGARFSLEHPDSYALILRSSDGPTLKDFNRAARKRASEIEPQFTRGFARILAAQAMTQTENEADIAGGIDQLRSISDGCGADTAFERGWIDHALLGAYCRCDRTAEGEALAHRVAARLVLRRAL